MAPRETSAPSGLAATSSMLAPDSSTLRETWTDVITMGMVSISTQRDTRFGSLSSEPPWQESQKIQPDRCHRASDDSTGGAARIRLHRGLGGLGGGLIL